MSLRSSIRAGLSAAPLIVMLLVAGCASRVAAPKARAGSPAGAPGPRPPDEAVFRIGLTDSALIASVGPGLARSVDHGADWSLAYPVGADDDIATIGSTVLAANRNGLLESSNDGLSWLWTPPESGLPAGEEVTQLAVDDDGTVYAIGAFQGVYRSHDRGSHWQAASTGLPAGPMFEIVADGGIVFARDGLQLYRSANRGDTWETVPVPIAALAGGDGLFFILRSGVGLFVSGDGGFTWTGMATLAPEILVERLVVHDAQLFAITTSGLYRAAGNLSSWSRLPVGAPDAPRVDDVAARNGVLYAATRSLGIQRSDDGGATWKRLGPTGGTPYGASGSAAVAQRLTARLSIAR